MADSDFLERNSSLAAGWFASSSGKERMQTKRPPANLPRTSHTGLPRTSHEKWPTSHGKPVNVRHFPPLCMARD
jgi:hypothetical protein